jgi:erythrocyte band 7 integral membrane protein
LTFPFGFLLSIPYCVKLVKDYERIIILRLGRVLNRNPCGTIFVLPLIDKYFIIDLRLITFNVQPQQVLTNDSGKRFVRDLLAQ